MNARRAVALLVGFAWLSACSCNSPTPCVTDSDCDPTQFCDINSGYCATLDAGTDAGQADAGCPAPCPSWEICATGACLSLYTGVTWTNPTSNGFANASVALSANLNVVPNEDPLRMDPATLSWSATPTQGAVENGVMTLLGDGTYTGSWAPAQEGGYTLAASYPDAGLSDTIQVTVIKTPPTFTVSAPAPVRDSGIDVDPAPGFAGAWRRDEIVPLTIASASPFINGSSVSILVVGAAGNDAGAAGPLLSVQPGAGCGEPYCATATLDLTLPAFDVFHGYVQLRLSGQDQARNPGTGGLNLPVTRWKWAYPTRSPLSGRPVVGGTGTVYLGTTDGRIVALTPDGTAKWTADAGAVETRLAVGGGAAAEVLYAAVAVDGGSALEALNASGAVVASCAAPSPALNGIAVMSTTVAGQTLESAVALFDGALGTLVALRPGAAAGKVCFTQSGTPSAPAGTDLVIDGLGAVSYLDGSGFVDDFQFSDSGFNPVFAAPIGDAGVLAVYQDGVLGAGGPSSNGVFSFTPNGFLLWSFGDGGTSVSGGPAISDGGVVWWGDSSGALTSAQVGSQTPLAVGSVSAPVVSTPILGNNGFVYLVDQSGTFSAFDRQWTPHWSFAPGGPGASISIDCARDGAGNLLHAPGVAYVAAANGTVFALVTDSHGLDLTAPWPIEGHDPRATGNAAVSLAPFQCF